MIHRCTKHNFTLELQSLYTISPKKEPELLGKMASSKTVAENVQDKPGILKSFQNPWLYKKETDYVADHALITKLILH